MIGENAHRAADARARCWSTGASVPRRNGRSVLHHLGISASWIEMYTAGTDEVIAVGQPFEGLADRIVSARASYQRWERSSPCDTRPRASLTASIAAVSPSRAVTMM